MDQASVSPPPAPAWLSSALQSRSWMRIVQAGKLAQTPVKRRVAAVSVGVIDGEVRLDLDYEEDVRAEMDMNVVMSSAQQFVEGAGNRRARNVRPEAAR